METFYDLGEQSSQTISNFFNSKSKQVISIDKEWVWKDGDPHTEECGNLWKD